MKQFSAFIEIDVSLSFSQEHYTGPYPETADQANILASYI
jgi:hypothetical protein